MGQNHDIFTAQPFYPDIDYVKFSPPLFYLFFYPELQTSSVTTPYQLRTKSNTRLS